MALTISKRNQARNEQALQELIRTVPGNERCADCEARNPGWASWSLGIFICMRCAALHRKLGTHISKVKSLSMDAWSNEQVEQMSSNGNTKANELWNPKRNKPSIPVDNDEVDSAMERFIRQKYEQKKFIAGASSKPPRPTPMYSSRGDTQRDIQRDTQRDTRPDSPVSFNENPPPPPPKPGRKFGFGLRSASSGSFLSRGHHKEKPSSINPLKLNKESRVFGATIGVTQNGEDLNVKLLQLKEMGFPDTKQNTSVLKGNGGNLEKAIESLIKLGKGYASSEQAKLAPAASPVEPRVTAGSGISVSKSPSIPEHNSTSTTPQTARSTNPFEMQNQSATSNFDAAMANMTISSPQIQQQQQMSPHSTGGYAAFPPQFQQAQYQQDQHQRAQYQQSMTPPLSQAQQFNYNPYVQQPIHNPFIAGQRSTLRSVTDPYPTAMSTNPFLQPAIQPQAVSPQYSTFSQEAFNPQQQFFMQSPTSAQPLMNDFGSFQQHVQSPGITPHSPAMSYNPFQQQVQQVQQIFPQSPAKLDKNSIMALYNNPPPASDQAQWK